MAAALEASRLEPDEAFERLIRHGIIDRQGRVTRLFGTAGVEPEPEALEYLAQQKKPNGAPEPKRPKKNSKKPKR